MTEEFSPKQEGYKKGKYSQMQQQVLDTVITEHGGNAIEAAKAAGYSNPYQVVGTLRSELIELAEVVLAKYAIPAAMKIGEVLTATNENPVIQANEKLKAAQLILERTNPKTEKVDISGEVKGGMFFLPAKRPIDE